MSWKRRTGEFVRVIAGQTLMERSISRALLPRIRAISARLGPEARVLDVGAKDSPYRRLLDRFHFETVDVRPDEEPDYVADVHQLDRVLPEACFDLVICTEVLEHTYDPALAVEQMRRVLKPGGILLATTPFIVPYHPDPHDYWRLTPESWSLLLTRWAKFEVVPHGNQCLAVWYIAGMGWGMPLRLLDRVVYSSLRRMRSKRVFLGFTVEAAK